MNIPVEKIVGYVTLTSAIVAGLAWIDSRYDKYQASIVRDRRIELKSQSRDLKRDAEAYHFFQQQEIEGSLTPVQKKRLEFLGRQVEKKQEDIEELEEQIEELEQ